MGWCPLLCNGPLIDSERAGTGNGDQHVYLRGPRLRASHDDPVAARAATVTRRESQPLRMAARLVELALVTPVGLAPDMAGPQLYGLAELGPRSTAVARTGARGCAAYWPSSALIRTGAACRGREYEGIQERSHLL